MRAISTSRAVKQEEPTCKLENCVGKSHNQVWEGSLLVFVLGVGILWRLCNTNVLHSQGKGVSQAATSSQPCSPQPWDSSSPARRTSCSQVWSELPLPVHPSPWYLSHHYEAQELRLPCGNLCECHWGSSVVLPTCWDGVIYLSCYLAFLTFSEEHRWGIQCLQNLIKAKGYQGMFLLWEAEQMC